MDISETDCREILKHLSVYIDGEIAGQDCVVIEQHLASCSYCFRYAAFEKGIKEIVARKCSGESAPASVVEALRARLRDQA